MFSTNLNLVSRPATDWQLQRPLAALRLHQPDAAQTAIPQFVSYDTSVGHVDDRRAGAVRPRPDDVRCGRDVERAPAAGA